jgi:hypothetical protein
LQKLQKRILVISHFFSFLEFTNFRCELTELFFSIISQLIQKSIIYSGISLSLSDRIFHISVNSLFCPLPCYTFLVYMVQKFTKAYNIIYQWKNVIISIILVILTPKLHELGLSHYTHTEWRSQKFVLGGANPQICSKKPP